MNIISGRGNSRKTLVVFPCAEIVRRSSAEEVVMARSLLCDMFGIDTTMTTKDKKKAKEAEIV